MNGAELETIDEHRLSLLLVEQAIQKRNDSMDSISDFIPGHFHINNASNLVLKYMGKSGCHYLGKSSSELVEIGASFLSDFIHPDATMYAHPKVIQFAQKAHQGNTFCYFEKVRPGPDTTYYDWFLSVCKIYKKHEIIYNSIPVASIDTYSKKIINILDDNIFIRKNFRKFAALTKREVEIIKLVAQTNTRRQIADRLCISIHTLDQHRKNIREKLNINKFSDVIRYAEAFGVTL
ncbi:helix-turn-helix transcriptional regulator [Aliikangiella sp. IMCC44359]|uniref:helix-turn-helix transcriptional regulator n=1 Tax=Aliikangiella sp. IMCC44359 TaxID=3459125 RepID=UPI00403B2864